MYIPKVLRLFFCVNIKLSTNINYTQVFHARPQKCGVGNYLNLMTLYAH